MERFIKLRKQIDGLYQVTRDISKLSEEKVVFSSVELIEAFRHLKNAGSWTGEIMKVLQAPLQQKADVTAWKVKMGWNDLDRMNKVLLIRTKVDELLGSITSDWTANIASYTKDKEAISYVVICLAALHTNLIEAKFALGDEIDRINGH